MKNTEGIAFERELPRGYRVARVIDAKNKRFAITFNTISILVLIAVVAIAFIPLLINVERLQEAEDVYALPILLFIILIAYVILHELAHGIAYKIQTGEKLTFGISPSCAFCGVPKIFTYRKTALIAVLAPTVVFSLVLLPIMVVYYFINAYTYLMLAIIFGMHLGGGCCDIYIVYLLMTKYKDNKTLMNDTGPKMTLFVYDESILDSQDEATACFICEFNDEEKQAAMAKQDTTATAKLFSIICIVLFAIGALLFILLTIMQQTDDTMLYPVPYPLYKQPSFYLALISVAGIIFCALTMKRFAGGKIFLMVILVLIGPVLLLLGALGFSGVSYTTDINNYGVYDYPEYMPDYFPEEITEGMTPITYSYYFDYSWDWCYELYLEVEMTEKEYHSYKEKYKNHITPCWYDNEYSEYVIDDDINLRASDDGDYYMDSPEIKKIIFKDDKNVVIFLSIYGIDPFYFENSVFFEKFDIDPQVYEKMTCKEEK